MKEALELTEHSLLPILQWLRLAIEITGAVFIAIGFVVALSALIKAHHRDKPARFTPIRLDFARYLSLALEFQLAADILSTTIAPTWEELGKLGVTAVIRTGLNYFLSLEIKGEKAEKAERELQETAVVGRTEAPIQAAAP